jgi:hypothetical protein
MEEEKSMRRRLLLTVAALLSAAGTAFADMGTPGFSRVPHDFVFDVDSEVPGYRFWLVSARGVEPLDLAPGRPALVDSASRLGSHRVAWLVAAPVGLVEGMGEAAFQEAHGNGKLPPGVSQSEKIDFLGSVPFFDSHERLVDHFRVEFSPGQPIQLVFLGRDAGSPRVRTAWAVAGVFALVAIVWAGWRALRPRSAKKQSLT